MASYNNQVIDLPAIEENYGNFKNSQRIFGVANSTFTNGYLRSCGDKNIKNAFNALDETYKKIRNGYTSIDDWWKSYTKDVASLERSIIGAGADFDEGSIASQVAKLPRLGKGILGPLGFNLGLIVTDKIVGPVSEKVTKERKEQEVRERKLKEAREWAEGLYFNQGDGDWANVIYDATGDTIRGGGCGLVSITHVVDILLGLGYKPHEINEQLLAWAAEKGYSRGYYAPGGSYVPALAEFAVDKYGFEMETFDKNDPNGARKAVEKMKETGGAIIFSAGPNHGQVFKDPITNNNYSANHVVMAYDTDGDTVFVKDSGRAGGNSVEYSVDEIAKINFVDYHVLWKEEPEPLLSKTPRTLG